MYRMWHGCWSVSLPWCTVRCRHRCVFEFVTRLLRFLQNFRRVKFILHRKFHKNTIKKKKVESTFVIFFVFLKLIIHKKIRLHQILA